MIKKIAYTLFLAWPIALFANEPRDWQLGFQKSASKSMDDIVWFHDYMLVPIITAITAFVLFLLLYVCVRYRASKNQVPSTTSHNTLIEVIWTLVPCLILIVTSAFGMVSWEYKTLKEGTAITINIRHGIKVQRTSINVL